MHICHVTSALAGGPATSIGLLSARQAAAGHAVSLVYSSTRDDIWLYRKRFDHFRTVVPWRVGRAIGPGDVPALIELVRLLRRLQPDMVHLHCSKAGAHGRLAARFLGLPCVFVAHGVSFLRTAKPLSRIVYRSLERLLALGGEPLVACSESEAEHLRRVARTVHVIPNAVDLASLAAISSEAQRPDRPFTVGILGLIKYQRMPDLVRRLCGEAPPAWRWLWVGDGPLRHLVEGLPNLAILGWREHADALRLINDVDVVLHASRWEGMPNALLEVMALGKPVVVSDVVGTRDIVEHGVDGFLVEDVFSTNAYLSALRKLEADPRLRAEIGERARDRVYREHDADVVFRQWRDLYEQVLAKEVQPGRTRRRRTATPVGAIADLSSLDA